jgi:hypothetical protein
MADEIIDLSNFIERRASSDAPPGMMALWGADGERSRFALPMWRVVHIAGAERGVIFWRPVSGDTTSRPFVVLDVGHEPARLQLSEAVTVCEERPSAELHDRGPDGLVVCLGTKGDRVWGLVADGGSRESALSAKEREDILFLAGECAGLLFLWNFADEVED